MPTMIRTFSDKVTAAIFVGQRAKRVPPDVQHRARTKLVMLDAAHSLDDLKIPPANRLEALKGDRKGQWSIRVNDQWRICFKWRGIDAFDVEFTDYHG
jgi:proteic killer suppression protein